MHLALPLLVLTLHPGLVTAQSAGSWKIHDMSRPRPSTVTPGVQALPTAAPADAVMLFDGSSLSGWQKPDGQPAEWVLGDGFFETGTGTGSILTRRSFGDVQLHLEFATPEVVSGEGQGRGNSGVYFMTLYEVQILDSYQNVTYADGQAGSVYGQYPPLFNASRPPGEWQSYDIMFRRPRFDRSGAVTAPARLTVIHNGVLIQNDVELWGPTDWLQFKPYQVHPDRMPIMLQDHSNPVRFRNIWARELLPEEAPAGVDEEEPPTVTLLPERLDGYVGSYRLSWGAPVRIERQGQRLRYLIGDSVIDLIPKSNTDFHFRLTDARIVFDLDASGRARGFTMHIGGEETAAERT